MPTEKTSHIYAKATRCSEDEHIWHPLFDDNNGALLTNKYSNRVVGGSLLNKPS